MKRISNSRLCLYLIAATYLVTLTVYDQLIFELTQEYTNWRNTRENLEHAPSARKLFTFDKNEVPRDRNGERKRVILLWRPRFGGLYHSPNLCDNCHLTYDQSSVAEADAVVFHCAETSDMRERYPWQQRVPNQRQGTVKGFMVYDQLLYEWIQEYYYNYMTKESLKIHPESKRLFNFTGYNRNDNLRTILMWRPRYGGVRSSSNLCGNCQITYDHSSISEVDAVLFHCSDVSDMPERYPLKQRVARQRWVWYCMEPPWMLRYLYERKLTAMSGIFNWTMTYRTDSDIHASHILDIATISGDELDARIRNKEKTAAVSWVVSNCRNKQRMDLVNELAKHVSVDIFGDCANRHVASVTAVATKYKFYLAFENSKCKDYITEKFWRNSLSTGAVPVVSGPPREEYELVAPPNSFIHVDDFESTKELAEYLKKLDKDDAAYRKYLEWKLDLGWKEKKRALLPGYGQSGLCQLCDKLHQSSDKEEVVDNLAQWWYGKGYKPSDPHFPVCRADSPQNGYSLHWVVTLVYSAVFAVAALVVYCMARRSSRGTTSRCCAA